MTPTRPQRQLSPQNSEQEGFYDKVKNMMSFAPGGQSDRQHERPRTPPERSNTPPRTSPSGYGHQHHYSSHQQPSGRVSGGGGGHYHAPQNHAPPPPPQHHAPPPNNQQNPQQVRDLQHRIGVLEAQLQEVDELKRRLTAEQRTANEWKEKWNYQNFKLNLMVDMLVLRVMEQHAGGQQPQGQQPQQYQSAPRAGNTEVQMSGQPGMQGVGKMAASRHGDPEMIEESFDDY